MDDSQVLTLYISQVRLNIARVAEISGKTVCEVERIINNFKKG